MNYHEEINLDIISKKFPNHNFSTIETDENVLIFIDGVNSLISFPIYQNYSNGFVEDLIFKIRKYLIKKGETIMNNVKDNEKLTITITGPSGIGKTVLGAWINYRLFNNKAIRRNSYFTHLPLPNFNECNCPKFILEFDTYIKSKGIKEIVIEEKSIEETDKEMYDRLNPIDKIIDNEYKHMEEFILSRGWNKKEFTNYFFYEKQIGVKELHGYNVPEMYTTIKLEEAYLKELKGEV